MQLESKSKAVELLTRQCLTPIRSLILFECYTREDAEKFLARVQVFGE